MTGFQPSIYCLYIFLPETCGLKSILPFSWPWRINTSKSLYCKKQWSPMFVCHRCGPLLCIGYFNWNFMLQKISKKKKRERREMRLSKSWTLKILRLLQIDGCGGKSIFSYIWSGNQGEGRCIYWIGLTYIMGDVGLGSVEPTGHLSFWEMKSTIYLPKIEECELLCYLESIHSLLWWLNFCWLALL